MKSELSHFAKAGIAAQILAILGSLLIVAGLVWLMQKYTAPAPVDQNRIGLRKKNLAELKAANTNALTTYAWQGDKAKGIVRIPLEHAMELALREWQNPAAARSNLILRAEKAAEAPPPPPEVKVQYE